MPLLVIHGHSTLLPWSRFGFVLFCFFYPRKFKQSSTPGTGSQTGTYISYFIFISTGLRPSSFLLLFLLISYILFRIKRRLECAYSSTRSKMSKFRSHTTSPEPKNTSFLPLLNRQHRHFDPWKEPWLYVCVCVIREWGGKTLQEKPLCSIGGARAPSSGVLLESSWGCGCVGKASSLANVCLFKSAHKTINKLFSIKSCGDNRSTDVRFGSRFVRVRMKAFWSKYIYIYKKSISSDSFISRRKYFMCVFV